MQVAKWGNSLAARLPKKVVEELGLKAGDEIDFVVADQGGIEINKDDRREKALERMRERKWPVPEGYHFDRDEANGR